MECLVLFIEDFILLLDKVMGVTVKLYDRLKDYTEHFSYSHAFWAERTD